MKKKKLGLVSAFCVGMLSLASCSQPQTSYGAPQSDPSADCYSSLSEEPQDVYGPPPTEDEPSSDESTEAETSAPESVSEESQSAVDIPDSIFEAPQLVYGPPPTPNMPDTLH